MLAIPPPGGGVLLLPVWLCRICRDSGLLKIHLLGLRNLCGRLIDSLTFRKLEDMMSVHEDAPPSHAVPLLRFTSTESDLCLVVSMVTVVNPPVLIIAAERRCPTFSDLPAGPGWRRKLKRFGIVR